MQKHIIGGNGIGYILGEEGLYYPDLQIFGFGKVHDKRMSK